MPFAATWMGLEVSQKEKDKYHMIPLKCGIYNMTQMNLQNRHILRGQTCGCQGGRRRGGMNWELGISRCKLSSTEWINNKGLLCSTGNCLQ